MKRRIAVLGAGFGGLELSTLLSESLGDEIEVTLIDKNDAFVFGYSKLDVMFGLMSISFPGPKPTGTYHAPTVAMRADKELFGSSRGARWFGL